MIEFVLGLLAGIYAGGFLLALALARHTEPRLSGILWAALLWPVALTGRPFEVEDD